MLFQKRRGASICNQLRLPGSNGGHGSKVIRNLAMGSVFCIVFGCAATPPDRCSEHHLSAAAKAAVENAQTVAGFVGDNTSCADSGVSPADAYAKALASFCNPADAWVAGKQGQGAATVCQSLESHLWREAYNLGRQLNTFELQLESLDHELTSLAGRAEAATRMGQLKLQRIKVAREIESISGVASVRGWGKQAQVDAHE